MKHDDSSSLPDENDQNQPVYTPTYSNQQFSGYYNPNIPIQNPYSIPENPYGYQAEPVYPNMYGYGDSSQIPPNYYVSNNSSHNYFDDQSNINNTYCAENSPKEIESSAESENPLTINEDTPNNNNSRFSQVPPPQPQYMYDPESPNCRIIENDNHSEVEDNNDSNSQNSLKQCGCCCLKCICTTFTIIICIAILSSFLFR